MAIEFEKYLLRINFCGGYKQVIVTAIGGQRSATLAPLLRPNSNNSTDYWNNAAGCGGNDRDDVWGWFVATSSSTTIIYSPNARDAVVASFSSRCG